LSSAPAPATSASGAAEGVVGITILAEGTGPTARPGDKVAVHYTASLTDGTQFASSRDKNEPLVFTIGGRGIVKGMSLGVSGMKVGEKRRLVVPPSLAYGERSSTTIPANSTLVYEVELLGIQPK
jgi:FKBP-type peptidyl-prolyl cis-trans isomerase